MSDKLIKIDNIKNCSQCSSLSSDGGGIWICRKTGTRIPIKNMHEDGVFPYDCPLPEMVNPADNVNKITQRNQSETIPLPGMVRCPLCGSSLALEIKRDIDGYCQPEAFCQGDTCGVGINLGAFGSGISDAEVIDICIKMLVKRPPVEGTEEVKYFKVACRWTMCGTIVVKAKDLKDATASVTNNTVELPGNGEYLDDSFEVLEEDTYTLNGEGEDN